MRNLITFGSTENPFNAAMVKLLNNHWSTAVKKIPGSSFKMGLPDIEGFFGGGFCALENKFIKRLPDSMRGDTVVLKEDVFSINQRSFFTEKLMAFDVACRHEDFSIAYMGSLIGVNVAPKIVIGVPLRFITENLTLTADEVRKMLQQARVNNSPFIRYGNSEVYQDLTELVRTLRCH